MRPEDAVQAAVCQYLWVQYPDVLFWSSLNGAALAGDVRRRVAQVNRAKRTGMLPGVSDLCIFEPRGGYSCMFLELKRDGGGSGASENQLHFIREVEARGAFGAVAAGFDEAQAMLTDYLEGRTVRPGPLDKPGKVR